MKSKKLIEQVHDKIILAAVDNYAVALDAEIINDAISSSKQWPNVSGLGMRYVTSFPENPVMGDIVNVHGTVKVWNGTDWLELRRTYPDGTVLEGAALEAIVKAEKALKIFNGLGD